MPSADAADGERRNASGVRNASDVAGTVILGACAVWSLATAAAHNGRPEGVLLAVLAVAAGYAAGRMSGALLPVAAPCAWALAGVALAVAVPHLAPGPQIVAPLGHAGATAAVLALSAGSACCAVWACRSRAARLALGVPAVATVVASVVLGSAAGGVACGAVLVCSLAAGHMRHRGSGILGLALAAALVAGLTWAVASHHLPGGLATVLDGHLTSHRVRLWHDALDMARQDAALGVGPGRFGDLSATATATATGLPPADGKPHSAPLQQAAEQGVTGVVLLAAVFGWVLHALWRTPRPTPIALTAGAALTVLAAIASAGNALSFTAVTAGAGVLAGLATARPFTDEVQELPSPPG
ncbi:O-antigen ligase family protein [Streptomyces sp. NPDC005925]|uniref:O-antigen ligase family protein n=1 Tax=Streptomyces sp. NPDC005925 TaxID=3157172 RepID=UPI0033D96193